MNTDDKELEYEKVIATLDTNIGAQMTEEQENGNITEADLIAIIQGIWPIIGILHKNIMLDEEDCAIIQRKLLAKYTVRIEGENIAITGEKDHHPWVAQISGDNDWFFWERFKRYYMENKWTKDAVVNLNQTAEDILNLLGNPQSKESFNRRGLIMGDVQAGKTANYTALCAKAADAGYKVIIVLTGMLEDLRKQTQERMDIELTGIDSAAYANRRRFCSIGVGKDRHKNERGKKIKPFTSTATTGDFKVDFLRNDLSEMGDYQKHLSALFVVKKNKSILGNLAEWLERSIKPGEDKIQLPLLLIDDEADNASVNTHDPEKDEEPTAINQGIRRILAMFNQTSYVGVTATPFANIFIDPDTNDEMLKDDLFPRDFIYALNQTSPEYVGAEKLFLNESFRDEHIRLISDLETYDDESDFPPGSVHYWFDYKHKKEDELPDGLPDDLIEALNYFLLVNAIRDVRHDRRRHRTMLVHTSRYTNIHEQTGQHIRIWLDDMKSLLRAYASKKMTDAERDEISEFRVLHQIFEKEKLGKLGKISWKKLCNQYLKAAVEPIQVRVRNSNKADILNYADYKDGMRVIAIGGNSFSRGLTLEGLCVTYFYRRATMYDSLIQMGRWFGYRNGYEDLCRVWLSNSAIDWFTAITKAVQELKADIYFMQQNHQAPKDFGLKVRRDPEAVGLMITARNKMNRAHQYRMPIVLNGKFIETPRLNPDDTQANMELLKSFVQQLSLAETVPQGSQRYFWRGIAKRKVADLLCSFKSSIWNLSYHGDAIAEYIMNKMDDSLWDVYIPSVASNNTVITMPAASAELVLHLMEREIELKKDKDKNKAYIKVSRHSVRIGVGGITKIGLTSQEIDEVKKDWRKGHGAKKVPDAAFMRRRSTPILILYFLQVSNSKDYPDCPKILPAIGVGFPGTGDPAQYAEYVINETAYNELCQLSQDGGDE